MRKSPSRYSRAVTEHAFAARDAFHEVGCSVVEAGHARLVVDTTVPLIYDSNVATKVRASAPDEIEAFLAAGDDVYAHCAHRNVLVDLDTPPALEARLALDGYETDHWVELLLTGDLRIDPPPMEIRPVTTDADWESFGRLLRIDHVEDATKGNHPPFAVAVTDQMVEAERAAAPAVQFFIASCDGVDAGFFSSWPGLDGMGIVEDLFCHPDHRKRGVASALVAHCVADARNRGADSILISAAADDWPRLFYHRAGFDPIAVRRDWLLTHTRAYANSISEPQISRLDRGSLS